MRVNVSTSTSKRIADGATLVIVPASDIPPDAELWNDGLDIYVGRYGPKARRPATVDEPLEIAEPWYFDEEHNRVFYLADADENGEVPYLVSGAGGFGGGVGHFRTDSWHPACEATSRFIRHRPIVTSIAVKRLRDVSNAECHMAGFNFQEAYVHFGCDWTADHGSWQPKRFVWMIGIERSVM